MARPTIDLEEMSAIGAAMRKARTKAGFTQLQLAPACNLSHQVVISRWENGWASPTLATAIKAARALGVSVSEYIGETK